jgi:hypothetical protein
VVQVGSNSSGVTDTAAQRTATREEVIEDIAEQADDLCHIHDHITRVITNIETLISIDHNIAVSRTSQSVN